MGDKSYELKKESGIIDFAIKTRGNVTDKYNELVTIRSFCDKILNTYFVDNDITKCTPASFEPTIDYVVTKMPRFAFEKVLFQG